MAKKFFFDFSLGEWPKAMMINVGDQDEGRVIIFGRRWQRHRNGFLQVEKSLGFGENLKFQQFGKKSSNPQSKVCTARGIVGIEKSSRGGQKNGRQREK